MTVRMLSVVSLVATTLSTGSSACNHGEAMRIGSLDGSVPVTAQGGAGGAGLGGYASDASSGSGGTSGGSGGISVPDAPGSTGGVDASSGGQPGSGGWIGNITRVQGKDGCPIVDGAEIRCSAALRGAFSSTGGMTVARRSHAATLLGSGKVLLVGGDDVRNPSLTVGTAELYDVPAGTFTATGSLASIRSFPTATLLKGGGVLVAGGSNGEGDVRSDARAELYDEATGTFTMGAAFAATATQTSVWQRVYNTATLLFSGKVLVAGGMPISVSGFRGYPSAELYDEAAGAFAATGTMTTFRTQHTATLLANGQVLIAGGYAGGNDAFASAELYDPATGTFASTGSMAVTRRLHTATLLIDGRVLIAGGEYNVASQASAELYDPASGTFTATGSMITARSTHTATLLCDGRVLMVGGSGGDFASGLTTLTSAEVYDPATGTFSPTGGLAASRVHHTATRLCDGRVLVAGGTDANTAELYQ